MSEALKFPRRSRLAALDVARYLAFVGMALVNFRIVAEPSQNGGYATLVTNALEGRAAALFVVLAGIGISLSQASRYLLLRRAAFLFVIGMLNMTIFDADILHFYAFYFLVAVLFLKASDRALLIGAIMICAISLLAILSLDYERGWDWQTYSYADFWTLPGFFRHSVFNGWHPVFPWSAFLLIGMWVGRQQLADPALQWKLLIVGSVIAGLAMVPGSVLADPELAELFGTVPVPPGPFYILSGSASALAVVGLLLILAPGLERIGLVTAAAVPGRQTLTLYAGHILIGMGTMEALGWTRGALSALQVFWGSLAFCLLALVYAHVWAFWFRRGPLEMLMRRLAG